MGSESVLKRGVLLCVVMVLALAVPSVTVAEDTGSVTGTVTNGTAGGDPVEGLEVTLRRFQGMDLVQTYTTKVGAEGHYAFTDLPITDGEAYVASVTYKGVEYSGSNMILLTDNPQATTDVTVYETTSDRSQVSVVSRSVIVAGADPELELVELLEIIGVDNNGDRTYVSDGADVLRIPLPDGAAQITPQPGFDYGEPRMDNGVFVTTGPVVPGQHNALLQYRVPYSGTSASINLATDTPVNTLRVLVQSGQFTISSPGMNDNGTVEVSGDQYQVLAVDNPVIGDMVTVTIDGLPKAAGSGDSSRGPLYAAIGAGVALVIAAVLVFIVLRRRGRSNAVLGAPEGQPNASLEDQRLALAEELNRLDQERDAGEIDEETYRQEREEILGELRALSLRMRGLGEAEPS